jgi:hypothetical protein
MTDTGRRLETGRDPGIGGGGWLGNVFSSEARIKIRRMLLNHRKQSALTSSQIEYVQWDAYEEQRGDDNINAAMVARRADQGRDDNQHGAEDHLRGEWH